MLSFASSSTAVAALLTLGLAGTSSDAKSFSLRPGPKFRNFARTPAGGAVDGEVLAGAPVSNISISTSNVVQCGQATVSWTGANNPSTLTIGTGGYYVGITNIQTIPDLPGPSTEWTVAAQTGEDLIFQITDASGHVAYAQNVKVQSSGDSSCLADSSASDSTATSTTDASSGSTAAAGTSGTPNSSYSAPDEATASAAASTWSKSKSKSKTSSGSSAAAGATNGSSSLAPTPALNITAFSAPTSNVTSSSSTRSATLAAASDPVSGAASTASTGKIAFSLVAVAVGAMFL